MPPDEGDVEVLWHRASGRASTPPPVSPPRHRDAYSPSRPSGDDERGISPGVETLEAGGWKRRQERKLLQGGLGLPPPLPPPPLAPPPEARPPPPNVMDVFPKKLAVKVPKPGAVPKPKDIFIKETEDEAAQREKERRRFLASSAMSSDEAKMRLKAYAAMKAKEGEGIGMMYPSEKRKNKELRKFFDDERREEEERPKQRPVADSQLDKMAEITKEIELEKAEYEKKVEKHIKELRKRKRQTRSRSGSRGKRSSKSRGRSRERGRSSKSRGRSGSGYSEEGQREEGDGREDYTVARPFSPAPDPSTKEGRAKLYKMELEEKSKQFMEWEKHVRGKEEWEMELETTAAFKYLDDTPSPERQPDPDPVPPPQPQPPPEPPREEPSGFGSF